MNKNVSQKELDLLLTASHIRRKTKEIFDLTLNGKGQFDLHLDRLESAVKLTVSTTLSAYPDMSIPFHSRWEHFRAGGLDRVTNLEAEIGAANPKERARTKIDLAIVSVLLDAGAGMAWKYDDSRTHQQYSKSEGLAIASYNLFEKGFFSSDPEQPFQADAKRLSQITVQELATGFQVSDSNPLVGLEGRVNLLHQLAKTIEHTIFDFGILRRPGMIFDFLAAEAIKGEIDAERILRSLLLGLDQMWPPRMVLNGIHFGDVWSHPGLLAEGEFFESLVPFHKLSQWLSYSLIEPIQEAGITVKNIDGLTGLPEYRNGGLFWDLEIITPKSSFDITKSYHASTIEVIEWRALTVQLLDQVADGVRKYFRKTPDELPLAKILQGGTWTAGRVLAKEKRPDAGPPFLLDSDGTVF